MKKWVKIFIAVLVVVGLFYTFYFLWSKTRPKQVYYEIVTPAMDTISRYVVATGKVEPRDEVEIKPQIQGIISSVQREAGERITMGDVIATIAVVPETSTLSSAESRVELAKISLEQAQRNYDRTKELFENDVVSREEFENAETSLKQAVEELQNARDNLDITRSGSTARNASSNNTQIRATITGMILDVPIKVGNSVIQANNFSEGTTIATVADMNDMIFRGNVDETEVGRLFEGMQVDLTIGALQDVVLRAELEYVSPKATEENGVIMFEVKAAIRNQGDVFVRAGYSANASIMIEQRAGVLTVPESTLQFDNERKFVYILTGTDKSGVQTFEERNVVTGLSDGIKIEVMEGLTESDRVRGGVTTKEALAEQQKETSETAE